MEETKEKEYIISYETIFELLRREKDREELQKLDDKFYDDIRDYIRTNKKILTDQTTLTSFDDKKRRFEKELENLKKILKELYEKREKKVLNLAIDKSRIKTNIVDTSAMLKEEKEVFEFLVNFLDENKNKILLSLFEEQEKEKTEEKIEQKKENYAEKEETREFTLIEKEQEIKKETKLIRFIHAVPKFLGTELEEYGPFEEEDIANLPTEIAQILIDKGRAEEIKANP